MAAKRVALVTGGNQGIGLEIVKLMSSTEPATTVLMGYRSKEKAELAMKEIQAGGACANVEPIEIDVLNKSTIASARDTITSRFGALDVLFNNAGMAYKGDAFDADVARTTIATNYYGTLHACEALLPIMRENSRVVFTSSAAGKIKCIRGDELRERFLRPDLTVPELSALMDKFIADVAAGTYAEEGWPKTTYGVSKVGMTQLMRILARDTAKTRPGLVLAACCPGWCRTSMAGPAATKSAADGAVTPVWLATRPDPENGTVWTEKAPMEW